MSDSLPRLGIVGGTGLNALFDRIEQQRDIDTPYGRPSSPLSISRMAGNTVAFLPRHGSPHAIPPHRINYRANVWALRQVGVEHIIGVNAVGGINAQMQAGCLVVPDQLIDYTWGREHTYADGSADAELIHIDFTDPFDAGLRQRVIAAAGGVAATLFEGGVYGVTQGPRLETAAEIDRMQRDGCDIVGMTALPEAALARELGMAYASLCLVVNPAAGRGDQPLSMEAMQQVTEQGMTHIREALRAAVTATY